MDDTQRPGRRGVFVILAIVALTVALVSILGLNWFINILTAFSLLLLFVFVLALVFVVITAVIHRYVEKRRREIEQADADSLDQQIPPVPRRRRRNRSTDLWEDDGF